MEFERHIEKQLLDWKEGGSRKPLILRGARQVGKTTLVSSFAKTYRYSISLNLERVQDIGYFQNFEDAKTITEALFFSNKIPIEDISSTLLFIDEIQESPKAIHLLRYFYEDLPQLHVIAAGSLLEFALRDVSSFPVGRVEYLYLHALNFVEYLGALDHQQAINQLNKVPIEPFAHQTLLDLFHSYAIIGGMPEVVHRYIKDESIANLSKVYESIWQTYREDVGKYSNNDTQKNVIEHIISTASQSLDQRVKFQHFGNSNYRSREVGEALRKLDDARIIRLIYPATNVDIPIRLDFKKSPRLQFLDTGLVNHTLGIQANLLSYKDMSAAYKGRLIPHLIAQEVISLNTYADRKPNFWVREKNQSSAEVDLLITYHDKSIPVEIKSGSAGTLKSLHQYIELANHPYAIRVYAGAFKVEKHKTQGGTPYLLMNLPYYLGTKIHEYVEYFHANYSLDKEIN